MSEVVDREDEERCGPRLRFDWVPMLKLEAPKSLKTETKPAMLPIDFQAVEPKHVID
jgi:hypothetical protein